MRLRNTLAFLVFWCAGMLPLCRDFIVVCIHSGMLALWYAFLAICFRRGFVLFVVCCLCGVLSS